MDVRLPDGTVIQNVPDTITKAELTTKLAANGYDTAKLDAPADATAVLAQRQMRGAERERTGLGGFIENFGENVGDIATGVVQTPAALGALGRGAVANLPGVQAREDLLPSKALQLQAEKQMVRELPGQVAKSVVDAVIESAKNPAEVPGKLLDWAYKHPADVAMLGAAPLTKFLKVAGAAGKTAEAVQLAKGNANLGRVLGGMGTAAEGAAKVTPWLDPMKSAEAIGTQVAKGGTGLVNYLGNVVNPSQAEYARLIGGRMPEVRNALLANTNPYATAGEAAAQAGEIVYPALQKRLQGASPKAVEAFNSQAAERAAVGEAATGRAAGSESARVGLKKKAMEGGNELFESARSGAGSIDVEPVIPIIDDIILKDPANDFLSTELNAIKRKLHDIDPTTGNIEGLRSSQQDIASVIEDVRKTIRNTTDKGDLIKLGDVERALLEQFPGYEAATAAYKELHRGLHQREVGKTLDDVLKQKGGRSKFKTAFDAEAKTIESATGNTVYKRYSPLFKGNEQALRDLYKLRNDILSEEIFDAMAKKGAPAVKNLFKAEALPSAPWFSKITTLTNAILRRAQGKLTAKTAEKMAMDMLNPKDAAAALEKVMKKQATRTSRAAAMQSGAKAATSTPAGIGYRGANKLSEQYEENRNALSQ